jgi:Skp family chaperone for outer membrane proteins
MFGLKRTFFLSLCVGLLLGAAPLPAVAGSAPPLVAVVVDVQRILDESLAAKSVQKQLETQRAKFQTEIENEENGLRQAEQDLAKAHDQLTPDAYSDREQQLRQRFLTVERHVETRRKVLDQAFNDSMNMVHQNLDAIVSDVAHEHGANLVLIKQQVLWTDKALDLTDEVLAKLNEKLPQITVKMAPEEKDDGEQEKPSK